MRIVLDTNILISALMKDSLTREIILFSKNDFYYPEISLKEIEEYKDLILKKSEMDENEFKLIFERLKKHVNFVLDNKIKEDLQEAEKVMKEIDSDDAVFIACALAFPGSVIWSDDKHLKKQGKIKVYSTEELIEKRK